MIYCSAMEDWSEAYLLCPLLTINYIGLNDLTTLRNPSNKQSKEIPAHLGTMLGE